MRGIPSQKPNASVPDFPALTQSAIQKTIARFYLEIESAPGFYLSKITSQGFAVCDAFELAMTYSESEATAMKKIFSQFGLSLIQREAAQ